MSYFSDTRTALDARLDSLTGGLAIAWENVEYTPVRGTPFLRPSLLLSPAALMDLDTLQMQEGIYQIDIFYPLGDGPGTATDKADAIYDHFKASTTLTAGSVSVHIKQIDGPRSSLRDGAWFTSTVDIHFKTYAS